MDVVIVGGGFAGLSVAKGLRKSSHKVLLIDRTNHHVFQPLLYQVATAALSPSNITAPLREVLRRQDNTTVIMADVEAIDKDKRLVISSDGDSFPYDILVLAPGARHSYFGHPEWESEAPGLKTLLDAIEIKNRTLLAFERAERCDSEEEAKKEMQFAIIGGGPTGVEMAGAIAEIAKRTMYRNFRKINPLLTKIYLIEGGNRLLTSYPEKLSEKAQHDLEKMGVTVLLQTVVSKISEEGIWCNETFYPIRNVIWAAGNQASPLLKTLDVPLDKQGRVIVEPNLTVPGHPEIYVLGDAAACGNLPAIAPVALQQGQYVANKICGKTQKPFRYFDKGQMATIGRAKAVAQIGKRCFSGFLAWLSWGLIHILYLITFNNRLLVMIQWIFWYFSGQRNDRLIVKPFRKR
ncbi:MAG: NAD(P)/FAD-dependent oxidoreductase [Chlamydiia bacterium]|nr:NAD(P)/FAD-dependent oxidoreductase [Chlamydiia bacterium]